MAWTGWPPQAGVSETASYAWLSQLWECAREKALMIGADTHWPPAATFWGTGTITAIADHGDHSWTITDASLGDLPGGATDDGKYWSGATRPTTLCTSAKFWVNVQCNEGSDGGLRFLNGAYDLIVEDFPATGDPRDLKPWQVIRGRVTDNRNKSITATIRLADHVTAGYLASAASLVGNRFYLIRAGKPWWADKSFETGRWPDFPNDDEEWIGSLDTGKVYSDGRGYLIETINKLPRDRYHVDSEQIAWRADQFVGRHVLANGGNSLRRLTVTSNAAQTLFFGGLTHVPSAAEEAGTGAFAAAGPMTTAYAIEGAYLILASGGKGWPARTGLPTRLWYTGAQAKFWGHEPSDALAIQELMFAADEVRWAELESLAGGVDCGDEASIHREPDPLDKDLFSSKTNMCEPAEEYFAPHFYKSLRGLQAYIELIFSSFTREGYNGGTARPLAYSLARGFSDCPSFDSASSTISVARTIEGSGPSATTHSTYYFTVAGGFRPWAVYYDALKLDGDRVVQDRGFADPTTGRIVVGGASTNNATDLAAADLAHGLGGTVYYSPGWGPSHGPLEFAHLYESTAFIPDVDPGDGLLPTPSAMYPPRVKDYCCLHDDPPPDVCCKSCFGVGMWVYRGPSLAPKTYDAYGLAIDGGGTPFAFGDVANYAGDHHQDPGTNQQRRLGDSVVDLLYWDRLGEFQHPRDVQSALDATRKGKVTSSTCNSITDSSKDWFANWYGGGVGKVHTGVVVAGSATTLTIDASFADTSSEEHCWFAFERFIGTIFTSPFATFVVEVDHTVGSVTTTHLLPITSVTDYAVDVGNQIKIHFDAIAEGFAPAAGDVWRIVEPGTHLNRFRTRRVRVTSPAGAILGEVEITHSHRNTLFLPTRTTAFPIDSDYQIIEHVPGPSFQLAASPPTDGRPWQRLADGKYWVQPLGDDPRGRPWHKDAREDLPHPSPKRYGKTLKGDYVNLQTYTQIYEMFNRLFDVLGDAGFTSRANPAVPEQNQSGYGGEPEYWGSRETAHSIDEAAQIEWARDHTINYIDDDGNPVYYFRSKGEATGAPQFTSDYEVFTGPEGTGTVGETGGRVSQSVTARYAYPTTAATAPMRRIACQIDVFALAVIGPGNPDDLAPRTTISEGGGRVDVEEDRFGGGEAGYAFREYARLATIAYGGQAVGVTLVGPRVGSDDADRPPQPLVVPPNPPNLSGVPWDEAGFFALATGTVGYSFIRQVAIVSFRAGARYQ